MQALDSPSGYGPSISALQRPRGAVAYRRLRERWGAGADSTGERGAALASVGHAKAFNAHSCARHYLLDTAVGGASLVCVAIHTGLWGLGSFGMTAA